MSCVNVKLDVFVRGCVVRVAVIKTELQLSPNHKSSHWEYFLIISVLSLSITRTCEITDSDQRLTDSGVYLHMITVCPSWQKWLSLQKHECDW